MITVSLEILKVMQNAAHHLIVISVQMSTMTDSVPKTFSEINKVTKVVSQMVQLSIKRLFALIWENALKKTSIQK